MCWSASPWCVLAHAMTGWLAVYEPDIDMADDPVTLTLTVGRPSTHAAATRPAVVGHGRECTRVVA